MSPKTGTPGSADSIRNHLRVWLWFPAILIGTAVFSLAQTRGPIYPSYGDPQEEGAPTSSGETYIPVPIRGGAVELSEENRYGEARSLGAQDFKDDVFLNSRNPFGFSLSASQGYVKDISGVGVRQSTMFSSFSGRAFFNAGRRRSKLHLDFGAGYRYNYDGLNPDSPDYQANAQYSYQIAPNTSLQISNQFTHTYNDSWSFLSLYSPIQSDLNFSSEVLFNRQQITRNTSRASLHHNLGRRVSLGISGGYELYRYPELSLGTTNAFTVGGDFDLRLTDWLSLTNSYTAYLNSVNEEFRDARIHRLQAAGLDFSLGRAWRLWMSGGVELSDYQDETRIAESVSAGVGYTYSKSSLSLTYHRGFTSAIGISGLMHSDRINADFGYRITQWMNTRLESGYYRSRDQVDSGLLQTWSNGGSLGIALSSSLNMTLNGYYQKQSPRNYSTDDLEIERVTAFLSFEYVWPARRRAG